jgi:hypothetical protein
MAKQVVLQESPSRIASVLDDSVLTAYNASIQGFNEKAREALGKFGSKGVALTGSSPFMLAHLASSGLLPEDARLATRADLETATAKDNNFVRGNYVIPGLALRTAGDSHSPNDLPAKVLAADLEKRGIELGKGKLIPFGVLRLKEDENSAYGAVFELGDKADKGSILDLDQFKWDYVRSDGLSCAGLYRNRVWDSDSRDLAFSDGDGRVVVVSGEATSQKILDRHCTEFRAERDAKLAKVREELARIEEEYTEREASLRVE